MDFTKKSLIVFLVLTISFFLAVFTFKGNMLTGAAISTIPVEEQTGQTELVPVPEIDNNTPGTSTKLIIEPPLQVGETTKIDTKIDQEINTEPKIAKEKSSSLGIQQIDVQAIPAITLVLNTTNLTINDTNVNLTAYNTTQANGTSLKVIYNWVRGNTPIMMLNMPFEGINNTDYNNTGDYSGFGNNGSALVNAYWNSTGGYDGKGAYKFNMSVDSAIVIGNNSFQTGYRSICTKGCTISAWINPNNYSADAYRVIIARARTYDGGDFTTELIKFYVATTRQLWFIIGHNTTSNSRNCQANSPIIIENGTWQFVTARYNLTDTAVFVNGTEVGSTPCTFANVSEDAWANSAEPIIIGAQQAGSILSPFNGTIDEVTIFNRSLSAEQIFTLWKNQSNIIAAQETVGEENWSVIATPNNGTGDGTIARSNNVTILVDRNIIANSTQCGIVNQSIILTRDINTTDTCFIINVSNVVLDGGGYTLSGNGTGAGITVNNSIDFQVNNITIRNFLEVRNFTHGFNSSTFNGTVFNNSFNNNTYGLLINKLVGSNISYNRAINNSRLGFNLTLTSGETIPEVYNNTAQANGNIGFSIINYDAIIRLYNNTASNNTGNGFHLEGTEIFRAVDNKAQENGGVGFYCLSVSGGNSNISNNQAILNTGNGFTLVSSNDYFTNNIARENGENGFEFYNSNSIFKDNIAYSNTKSGFKGNNLFTSGYWSNNTAHSNEIAGIHFNSSMNVFNDRYYNNSYDIFLNTSGVSGNKFYNFTNITIDDPNGNYENETLLTLRDYLNQTSQYAINYSGVPANLPFNYNSFLKKFIQIISLNGTLVVNPLAGTSFINNISLSWQDSELIGQNESLSLWINYSGSWTLLNDSPKGSETDLSTVNLLNSGTLALLSTPYANSTQCGVVNQSLTLTRDVNISGTSCFVISASNISLDGGGFTISGNRTGAGITVNNIVNYRFNNVTIKNVAEVRNFTHGFNSSTFNGTIFNNSFNNNTNGIFIRNWVGSNISYNRAVNNSNAGFSLTVASSDVIPEVYNNTAQENGNGGFSIINNNAAISVYNNTALNNTAEGFTFNGNEAFRAVGNKAQENDGVGLSFVNLGSSDSNVFNNEAILNTGNGFSLDSSTNTNLSGNTAVKNGGSGFSFSDSPIQVRNNVAQGNNVSGFGIQAGTLVYRFWSENTAHSNKVAGIDIIGNNITAINDHYFNNTYDILSRNVSDTLIGVIFLRNFTNITIDNPIGNYENETLFTFTDDLNASASYFINHSKEPSTLPSGYSSFSNKFVRVANLTADTLNINNISLSWQDSELSVYNESLFNLWIYNSSWSLINESPSASENSLKIANLSSFGTLAILTNETFSVPGGQNSGGTSSSGDSSSTSTTTSVPTSPTPSEPSAPSEPSTAETASASETISAFESGLSTMSITSTGERAITSYTSEQSYMISITNNLDKTIVLSADLRKLEIPLKNEENVVERLKEELLLEGEVSEAALEKELNILKLLESVDILQVYKTKLSHLMPSSLVGATVGIPLFPTGKHIEANLLKDVILNTDELKSIEVDPGETVEKEIKIRRGLSLDQKTPQIIFYSGGKEILVKELENHKELVTGTAVDVDAKTKTFDYYIVIPPQKKEGKEIFTVEMYINVKRLKVAPDFPLKFTSPFFFEGESETIFSELYGPYNVNLQRGALLAVQYDASAISGDYEVVGKVYRKGTEKVAENHFEIKQ